MSTEATTCLTRTIPHAKTGHTFLVYCTLNSSSCTIDLTISGPSDDNKDFDTKLLRRWWTDHWEADALNTLGSTMDNIETSIEDGLIAIRGWTESKARQSSAASLKLVVASQDEVPDSQAQSQSQSESQQQAAGSAPRTTLQLRECSKEEALLRQKMLLLNFTTRAEDQQQCYLFPRRSVREQMADLHGEVASLNRQIKKKDRMIDDLKMKLETADQHLKEYIRDAAPTKPAHSQPKIPANHSKAAVTKKRRLVQKVEYED